MMEINVRFPEGICHSLLKLPSKITLIRFNGIDHAGIDATHNLNEEICHKLGCVSAERERDQTSPQQPLNAKIPFEIEAHGVTDVAHLEPEENLCWKKAPEIIQSNLPLKAEAASKQDRVIRGPCPEKF